MQEQFEAATSARSFDNSLNLSDPYSNLTLAAQSSALAEMKFANTSASAYLPDIKIEGLETAAVSAPVSASVQGDARNNGAVSTAREYWKDYVDESVAQGGISGFANYLWGNTMGYVVEGVQAAVDARDYWADAEKNATNPVSAVLAAGMHDILVPAAVLDHMGSALNDVSSANFNQVESGLRLGVLKREYGSAQDVMQTVDWLDKQIPRDGTAATEDRRTALLVALASAEAQKLVSDPKQQEEIAYDRLFSLRAGFVAFDKQLPENMRGRELDPDLAAAEHFFEVSKRVAADTMEMGFPGVGTTEVSTNGYITAPVWATIGAGYAIAKSAGILGGSQAGEHQSSWEMAGIMRGMEINSRSR